jgi:diadenosine tetraphosphate (Ap4A) HIT family hydrolase
MIDLSEKGLRENCPHCDPNSFALKHKLRTTEIFYIVCDVHPITEGHILIIPKQHLSCIGVYPDNLLEEVQALYQKTTSFIKTVYGSVSTFEHGITGQTVFHSHIQMFPYEGRIETIIPEGKQYLSCIDDIAYLQRI